MDKRKVTESKETRTLGCGESFNYDNDDDDYDDDATCGNCGGTRTWCEACRQYSAYCCEEYGTCECS